MDKFKKGDIIVVKYAPLTKYHIYHLSKTCYFVKDDKGEHYLFDKLTTDNYYNKLKINNHPHTEIFL